MDSEFSNQADTVSPTGSLFEKNLKKIINYSYASIFGLMISVTLLALDQRLIAGIIVIADAAFIVFLLRKWIAAIRKTGETMLDITNSNVQKDEVITGFSHRIREPLNNLVLISDMLLESGLEKKQKDLLETFVASTDNMVTIVNELTMQSAGNLNFGTRKKIKFRLLPTIKNTIELYELKDSSLLKLSIDDSEFDDFECFGDPIVLKQIFLAIFNNIENTDSDSQTAVSISIRTELKTGVQSTVSIKIITDKALRIVNDLKPDNDLVTRLIKAGNGYYTQERSEKQTVLVIFLPFNIIQEEPKQQIASSKMEELIQKTQTNKELKDLKVLIVEDNAINKKITELTLKPLVHSIDSASNGKEALDKFGSASYDLILMDIQMPVMSGLLAAEKIRALEESTNSHIPIIAITANAMLGDKEKCISAGIDDYISKPFQPSTLIEKIKMCI